MTGSMSQIVARVNGRIDDQIRMATLGVFIGIRKDTPVGEPSTWKNPAAAPAGYVGGNARNNWQCTIGAPFVGEDASGSDEKIQRTIPRRAGSVVYLTNNVQYIQPLEYGHSTKSPNGMVRINVARFEGLLNGTS
jgi:hypothetical protein